MRPQPFKTAPIDREVLVFCGRWVCGHYSYDHLDPERGQNGWITDLDWPGMVWPPTHWCDLPPDPTAGHNI